MRRFVLLLFGATLLTAVWLACASGGTTTTRVRGGAGAEALQEPLPKITVRVEEDRAVTIQGDTLEGPLALNLGEMEDRLQPDSVPPEIREEVGQYFFLRIDTDQGEGAWVGVQTTGVDGRLIRFHIDVPSEYFAWNETTGEWERREGDEGTYCHGMYDNPTSREALGGPDSCIPCGGILVCGEKPTCFD